MPSRCWDTQDILYLPVEILVKSKPCLSSVVLSQGIFAQGLRAGAGVPTGCWGDPSGAGDTHRIQGGTAGAKDASRVPGCLLGVGDVCQALGCPQGLE